LTTDFLVIGAGVIGVTVARELRRRLGAKVVVIDKEGRAAQPGSKTPR
jgi:L-2-hydroxyglutarate oxidase LhgO